jgi:O-antigen/teichoic acid export membrane protein
LFLGLEANAIYSVACKIPLLFTTVQSTFVFAWQENASMFSKDSDVDEYYSKMFESIFRILIGIMSLLIAFSPILFIVLIRGDYGDAYYQMPILFIAMLFSSLASFMGGIYVAHKKTKSVGITTVIAAAVNLIIDLLFVKYIGIFAASISTLISYIFLTIYRMIDVQKFQLMNFNIKFLFKCLALLVVMSVFCWMKNTATICINLLLGLGTAFILNRELLSNVFAFVRKKISK